METALYRKHYNNLLKQREKQGLIYDLSGILSPLIPFHSLATAIAKTDVTNHRAFEEAAEQYRYEFVQVLNRDVKENSRWGENYYADTTLWKKIPPFEYTSPPLSETLESHQGALLIAAVWLAVSLLAIFVCPRFLSNE